MGRRIAMLGLGAMGARMARRLIDAGHEVTVWNRTPDRSRDLAEHGARVVGTPREAARGQELVVAMVRDDDASREVWLGDDGALGGMDRGAVAIESSTLTPTWTASLAKAAEEAGVGFLEAPVAGSRPQAEAGQLIYFVGGHPETLEGARDVLGATAGAVHHVGPPGAGALMKLVVNALFGIQVAALGELLGLARKGGVDVGAAVEVLRQVPVTSPALAGVGGLIAAGKFAPMFPVDLVEKDFGYAEDTGEHLGAALPATRAARAAFVQARDAGFGDENIHAVAKLFL